MLVIPKNVREFVVAAVYCVLLTIAFKAFGILPVPWITCIASVIAGIFGAALILAPLAHFAGHLDTFTNEALAHFLFGSPLQEPPVDPWRMQRKLMRMSDQEIACGFMSTNTTALYSALILEEGSELILAYAAALGRYSKDCALPGQQHLLTDSVNLLSMTGESMKMASSGIRMILKHAAPYAFKFHLTPAEAREIADGTTDLAVVNSGFCVASGLPGAALYNEVGLSNISKGNPRTGKIDKDPSGKWIKGPAYFEPRIDAVLAEYDLFFGTAHRPDSTARA